MDILYHGVVGYAIAKSLGGKYETAGVIAAMFPDIVGSIPYFYFKLKEVSTKSWKSFWRDIRAIPFKNKFKNTIDRAPYHLTHSFFFSALVSALTYLFFRPAWLVVTLSYCSHIIIDIPTHDGDFATHFLYPFSDFHVEARNWAKNPGRFFTFWGCLITSLFLLRII